MVRQGGGVGAGGQQALRSCLRLSPVHLLSQPSISLTWGYRNRLSGSHTLIPFQRENQFFLLVWLLLHQALSACPAAQLWLWPRSWGHPLLARTLSVPVSSCLALVIFLLQNHQEPHACLGRGLRQECLNLLGSSQPWLHRRII